ncbi:MAG: PKD domain-containing protein [Desulfuromonadaceae bacterium]|nr:PKD domain-containing protein [Desulfuromonadaceae bacterium]
MKNFMLLGVCVLFAILTGCGGEGDVFNEEITNVAPIANAGANLSVETGSVVTLNGGATDADGDLVTFLWEFMSRPSGSSSSLSSPISANPSFTADLDGSYVLLLTVNDGIESSPADMIVVISSSLNATPVANAGADQNVVTNSTVSLYGSGSSDADGDLLSYQWTFVSIPPGSIASLSDSTAPTPTFVADLDGSYVLNLIVNDGTVDSQVNNMAVTCTSDYSGLFSKSVSSSTSKTNNAYGAGSSFSLSITNISNIPFVCTRAELFSGVSIVGGTEDASLLGGNQLDPNENIGVRFTLNTSVSDNGFEFRYYLNRPDTGETFIVKYLFL